jgi:ABC-type branched-subunit amino acid transport system ATPase component/MFS family permease
MLDRRLLVPPARDIATGTPVPEVAPPPLDGRVAEQLSNASRPSMVRAYLGQLNPFAIAGRRSGFALLIIAVVGLMTGADQQVLFILLPKMRAAFGSNLEALLVVNATINVMLLLVAPFVGWLADRVRRVWLLRIGGLVTSIGSTLIAAGVTPLQVLGFNNLSRLGVTVSSPAVGPLVSDYVEPAKRGRAFAFVFQFATIGGLGVPILIGLLADVYGWRGAYLSIGGVSIVATLLYFLLREPRRGGTDRVTGTASGQEETAAPPVSFGESFRRARASATLRRLWYAQIFMATASFVNLAIPIYMADVFHLSSLQYGTVVAAESATVFLTQFAVGPLVDRWLSTSPANIMYLLSAMPVVMVAELLVLWQAPTVWVAIPALMIGVPAATLLVPQFSPPLAAVLSLVVPARIRGFGMQSIQPWGVLAPVVLYATVGALQTQGVGERAQFLAFIPLLLVATVILVYAATGVAGDVRSALAATAAEEDVERKRSAGERPLLTCRGVEVSYDGAQVLFGVDLDLRRGEIVALLGTNGAGKSTLLHAITGLQPASSGAIYLESDDITYVPPDEIARRGVMLMPGGRALFGSLTVRENLAAVRWVDGDSGNTGIDEALHRFPQLRSRLSTPAGELSGGEQQMVALAQAFMRRPQLLLVDELSLGLAPAVVATLLDGLRELARSGITVVVVEQSVNVALQVAERAVFMEKGKVVFEGPVADLVARPDVVRSVFLTHAVTASSIGTRLRHDEPTATGSGDAPPAVSVHDVAVRYGGVQVLGGVSLVVNRGDVVGIVGANGAGKTTLFDVIAGSVRPARGAVHLGEHDVTHLSVDARARMGLVRSYQNVRLFPALTVRENIAVALERHLHAPSALQAAAWSPATRRTERRIARRVDNLVESLGLQSAANKFLSELSTGMRRIVDIACLLAAQPEVLLLDEPSSGLAQAEVEQLGPVVRRIVAETQCALLIIEHDLGLVSSLARRLVALDLGTVMAEGLPSQVLAREDVAAALLGGASRSVAERSLSPVTPAGTTQR